MYSQIWQLNNGITFDQLLQSFLSPHNINNILAWKLQTGRTVS